MRADLIKFIVDYGASSVTVLLIAIIWYFGSVIKNLLFKICTNHLKHIQDAMDKILNKVEKLEDEFVKIDKRVTILEVKEDK